MASSEVTFLEQQNTNLDNALNGDFVVDKHQQQQHQSPPESQFSPSGPVNLNENQQRQQQQHKQYYSPAPMPHVGYYAPAPLPNHMALLVRQVEWYLGPQNLPGDFFLRSKMSPDFWVPLALVASFRKMQMMGCNDIPALAAAIREMSELVEINDNYTHIRPNYLKAADAEKRSVLILRDVDPSATSQDIQQILDKHAVQGVQSVRIDVGSTWFITFNSADGAKTALETCKNETINGVPLKARVKADSILKSADNQPYAQQQFQQQQQQQLMHQQPPKPNQYLMQSNAIHSPYMHPPYQYMMPPESAPPYALHFGQQPFPLYSPQVNHNLDLTSYSPAGGPPLPPHAPHHPHSGHQNHQQHVLNQPSTDRNISPHQKKDSASLENQNGFVEGIDNSNQNHAHINPYSRPKQHNNYNNSNNNNNNYRNNKNRQKQNNNGHQPTFSNDNSSINNTNNNQLGNNNSSSNLNRPQHQRQTAQNNNLTSYSVSSNNNTTTNFRRGGSHEKNNQYVGQGHYSPYTNHMNNQNDILNNNNVNQAKYNNNNSSAQLATDMTGNVPPLYNNNNNNAIVNNNNIDSNSRTNEKSNNNNNSSGDVVQDSNKQFSSKKSARKAQGVNNLASKSISTQSKSSGSAADLAAKNVSPPQTLADISSENNFPPLSAVDDDKKSNPTTEKDATEQTDGSESREYSTALAAFHTSNEVVSMNGGDKTSTDYVTVVDATQKEISGGVSYASVLRTITQSQTAAASLSINNPSLPSASLKTDGASPITKEANGIGKTTTVAAVKSPVAPSLSANEPTKEASASQDVDSANNIVSSSSSTITTSLETTTTETDSTQLKPSVSVWANKPSSVLQAPTPPPPMVTTPAPPPPKKELPQPAKKEIKNNNNNRNGKKNSRPNGKNQCNKDKATNGSAGSKKDSRKGKNTNQDKPNEKATEKQSALKQSPSQKKSEGPELPPTAKGAWASGSPVSAPL